MVCFGEGGKAKTLLVGSDGQGFKKGF